MWKEAVIGAIVILTTGSGFVCADDPSGEPNTMVSQQARPVLTEAHIVQAHEALRLTADQEKYWPPIEIALRHLIQVSAQGDNTGGMLTRIRNRAAVGTAKAIGVRRVWIAAQPLIRVLDEDQKRRGLAMVRAIGIGNLASGF